MTMGTTDACRLCLTSFPSFVNCFTWIGNPHLKAQMEKVFSFQILPEAGLSSSVCQNCFFTISEFYLFSEKVRHNQETLMRARIKQEPLSHNEILPGDIDSESHIDDGHEETTEERQPKHELECVDIKIESNNIETEDVEQSQEEQKHPSNLEGNESNDKLSQSYVRLLKTKREKEDQYLRENFTLMCHLCNVVEPTFLMLREHFRTVHNSYNVYVTCCRENFGTRGDLIDHLKNHDNQTNNVKHKRKRDDQFISEHSVLRCHRCNVTKPTIDALRTHIRSVHCTDDVYIACRNEPLGTRSDLLCHIKSRHISVEQDSSDSAGEQSTTTESTEYKQLSLVNTRRELEDRFISEHFILKCYLCNAIEPTFQLLRNHFREAHHSYNVHVTCCDEKFSTRSYLISHIKEIHLRE